VERTTKRTTRSTTSAAVPTGRDGSGRTPKEWTFYSDAVADKFDRHVREILPWQDLATQAVAHALIVQRERILAQTDATAFSPNVSFSLLPIDALFAS
jgi:hypothetical protein